MTGAQPGVDNAPPETPVGAYYDAVAETWDETHGAGRQNRRFARQLRESVTALLAGEAGRPVALELGAGTGPYLALTAPMFGTLIASDVSGGMLSILARRSEHLGLTNVKLVHQDAGNLSDIAAASVDVVYSIGLLETVEDYDRLFAETFRVLKPGGLVAAITSNGSCPWYWLRRRLEGGERHGRTRQLANAARLNEALRRTGFAPAEVTYWGAIPPGLQSPALAAVLGVAEAIVAPTPLARFLGLLSLRSRKPAIR